MSNQDAYNNLSWVLDNADRGIYILIASRNMQSKLVQLYSSKRIAVYNYEKNIAPYSFQVLHNWILKHDANAYFIVNFDLALTDINDIQRLNLSRDMLANIRLPLLFFMSPFLDDRLAREAYDFYSYVHMRIVFEDETSEPENKKTVPIIQQPIYPESPHVHISDTEVRPDTLDDKQQLAYALALSRKAINELDSGHYANALSMLTQVLNIREQILGKEHPDTATTYNNIAIVYSRQGDYTKALLWYEKALAIHEQVLGKEHPDTATTYNNIAVVYDHQGDYEKALLWHEKALTIREQILGKEHPDTATTYNNIAVVYDHQGDYTKALLWYKKALAIREQVLGKEHPDTAATYNNIAGMYDYQGDYTKALLWYEKALTIREQFLGKEHPFIATTYNNIAVVYNHQGDYAKALLWYKKALPILEERLGAEHPYVQQVRKTIVNIKR